MILLYSGFGLESLNISFVDSNTYTLTEEQGKYLLSTFPTSFSITDSSINDIITKTLPEVVSSVVLDNTETEDTSKKRKRKIKE
jgi:hypothetical protein